MAPFFSIITAVYNGEDGLKKTAKSLQEQTCRDFEWIVVDGASTDGTLTIARDASDPDRDTVVSEPDDGVYDAMNKGLYLARGQVVQFLNANDWLASNDVLSEVMAAFDDGVDAVFGDTQFLLHNGRKVHRAADVRASFHRRMPFSHQAVFVQRTLHLRYPFDLNFKIAADMASLSKMHMSGANFVHVPIVANVNTIEPNAISISGRVRSAKEYYSVSVDVLKRPRLESAMIYLRKRLVIAAVNVLERLPDAWIERLPGKMRRKIY